MTKTVGKPCIAITVPKEACGVTFGRGRYHHSRDIGITVRGEWIHAEVDRNGRIIGLELLGDDKPCQGTSRRQAEHRSNPRRSAGKR